MMRFLSLFILMLSLNTWAQFTPVDDYHLWSTLRIEGNIELDEDSELPASLELHHRLRENMQNLHQLIVRPMVGHRLNQEATLWFGVAYIGTDVNGEIIDEYRFFQMLTYNKSIKDSIFLVSATRLEQRWVETDEQVNHRLRQMIRMTLPVWQRNQHKLDLFIANEIFVRLNQTNWSGARGFDQNRLVIGVDFRTHIKDRPVVFTGGYMVNTMANGQSIHGVQLGLRIPLQSKKQKIKGPPPLYHY